MNDRNWVFEQYCRGKERRDIHEILDLVMLINQAERQPQCKNSPEAFFKYGRGINGIDVTIYENGLHRGADVDYYRYARTPEEIRETIGDLEKIVHELSKRDSHGPT